MQKTILLVEDDLRDREMYGNLLWYNGYNVLLAEDGEAGLQQARENRPDLIILDLQLPLMHGLELSSRLKQSEVTKDIPVIALTGRRLSELGGNSAVLGYARFLEKPVSPLAVLREVETLIGRSVDDQATTSGRPRVFRTPPARASTPEYAVGTGVPRSAATAKLAAALRERADDVLARWADLVKEEPWFSLPPEHRQSNLREVLLAIADAMVAGADRAALRGLVLAGAQHGSNRRAQDVPEMLLPTELHLLRQALWRFLHEDLTADGATYDVMLIIDGRITLALNAGMWGYYRDEVEAHESWDAAVERLIDAGLDDAARQTA